MGQEQIHATTREREHLFPQSRKLGCNLIKYGDLFLNLGVSYKSTEKRESRRQKMTVFS